MGDPAVIDRRSSAQFVHRTWPARPRQWAPLRAEVRRWLAPLDLPGQAEDDLVLVVSETASKRRRARLPTADRRPPSSPPRPWWRRRRNDGQADVGRGSRVVPAGAIATSARSPRAGLECRRHRRGCRRDLHALRPRPRGAGPRFDVVGSVGRHQLTSSGPPPGAAQRESPFAARYRDGLSAHRSEEWMT